MLRRFLGVAVPVSVVFPAAAVVVMLPAEVGKKQGRRNRRSVSMVMVELIS